MYNSEVSMVEMKGCSSTIPFDIGIQQVAHVSNIVEIAEKHRLAMFQGVNGYIEVWINDNKNYCFQITNFDTAKDGDKNESVCIVDKHSFMIGDKKSVMSRLLSINEWLTQESGSYRNY